MGAVMEVVLPAADLTGKALAREPILAESLKHRGIYVTLLLFVQIMLLLLECMKISALPLNQTS